MKIENNSIVTPLPTDELIEAFENDSRVELPQDYKCFLKKYNGAIPETNMFTFKRRKYLVERFLCLLENYKDDYQNGPYEMRVIITQLDARLLEEEDEEQVLRKLKPKIPDHNDAHPVAEDMKLRRDSG